MVSATLTDCSTRMTGHPSAWMARTISQELLDDGRGQAQGQLVDDQQAGLGHERHAQAELLLLAAGQVPRHLVPAVLQPREQLQDPRRAGVDLGRVLLGEQPRRRLEVLGHGQRGEHRPAPGHLHDPQAGRARPDRRG